MKKLLFTLVAVALGVYSYASVLSTNVTSGGIHLLNTNRMNILSVTISSDKNLDVYFYDSDTVAAPYYGTNYVTAAYPTRVQYATNYVTTFVGQNGITNWYTNAGLWSLTITNAAATNALTSTAFTIGANTAVSFDVSLLNVNGLVARTTTNGTIIVNYNSGR